MPTTDINSNVPWQQFTATASQTVFNTNFIALDESYVVVNVDGTDQTLTTDYAVTNVGDEDGFTVTFVSGLTAGQVVTIYTNTDFARTSQYSVSGRLSAGALEADFDKIAIGMKELRRDINRAATLDYDDTLSDLTLPTPAASKLIGYNSDASGFTTYEFADIDISIDTALSGLANGDILSYNGTNWVNAPSSISFTPTLTRGTAATVVDSYTTRQGLCTKTGKLVNFVISIQINGSNISAQGSGFNKITGLPFSCVQPYTPVYIGFNDLFSSSAVDRAVIVGTEIYFAVGKTSAYLSEDWDTASGAKYLQIAGHYYTS